MAEQDRSRWNAARIAEGVALITGALGRGPAGPATSRSSATCTPAPPA
jgi:predicted RNA polymerase sigma factor